MERTIAEDPAATSFFFRRAARILPMYWVSMALAHLIAGPFDVPTILANAMFTADVAHAPLMVGVYWTLYVEVRFYTIVPLSRLAGEAAMKAAPYAAIAVNGILFARSGHPSHLLLYLTYCLAGMQLSMWQRARISSVSTICCISVVSSSAAIFTPDHPLVGLFPICGSAMICLAPMLTIRPLVLAFVGRVSYSWYLFHTLLGYPIIKTRGGQPHSVLLAVVVTFAASAVAFYAIETPAIAHARAMVRRLRPRSPVTYQ